MDTPTSKKKLGTPQQPDTPESHVAAAKKQTRVEAPKKPKEDKEPHQEEGGVHYFSFPLYELSCEKERLFVGGGGGDVNSGVPNMWGVFQWMPNTDSLKKLTLQSNGRHIVTNGALSPASLGQVAVGRGAQCGVVGWEDSVDMQMTTETAKLDKKDGDDDDNEQKACCYSSDGSLIVCGGTGGNVTVWDAKNAKLVLTVTAEYGPVTRLACAGASRVFAACCASTVWLFRLDCDEHQQWHCHRLATHASAKVVGKGAHFRGLAFAGPSSARVLVAGAVNRAAKESKICLFGGSDFGDVLQVLWSGSEPQTCLSASPDGSLVAAGTAEGAVAVWTLAAAPALVMRSRPHSFFVSGVAFSPDGSHVLSCSGDRSLRVQLIVQQRGRVPVTIVLSLLVLLAALWLLLFQ